MADDAVPLPVVQERWMALSPTKRGEIILAGLVAACTSIPVLNDARCLCAKEMSVKSHRQNARLFLDLLEQMRSPRIDHPSKPTYVSNPMWDEVVADQLAPKTTVSAKTALAQILSERNMLIGFVVNSTLRSILGLPPLQLYQTKNEHKPRLSRDSVQASAERIRAVGGEQYSREFEKVARQLEKGAYARSKEIYTQGKQACHACKKFNETTTKFPRCKRCWDAVGKSVVYCSTPLPRCSKPRHRGFQRVPSHWKGE
ncbi:hypothetical protein FB45DRAFT_866678 [Roridomyces roridus]|uniref:Uncharacterized protein n=1 Tax=Roridomyces roridus TaxID=1738132 RepID=A0AAD7FQK9_9AGAR|nr:hypothetical protein FB45DRAFT_866678 [Roridomyces roridus]